MDSNLPDSPPTRAEPNPDKLELIPDSLLLQILNNIGDVKSLGRCSLVSKRFRSLVPLVDRVLVPVDCVLSSDENDHHLSSCSSSSSSKLSSSFSRVFRPLHALAHLLLGSTPSSSPLYDKIDCAIIHHSPAQVLKNFSELKFLRIHLPSGELGVDDGVLLQWRAQFGSTLDNCVILGASSVTSANYINNHVNIVDENEYDNGSIPESFYTNGGLKLRVVWTISSLIAASARHYLLQPIIKEHPTLNNLVLTDGDGQGVLSMNKEQLAELRVKPLSVSTASKRTLVPALSMRLWYAPCLELPDGTVLNGATLVAIRPSEVSVVGGGGGGTKEVSDLLWVSTAFEEPYGTAAKMLLKRRTYCLEMNSF